MDQIEHLEKRISTLGNHYQKYLFTVKRFIEPLERALSSSGKLMQVHIWRSSFSPAEEMKIIRSLSEDPSTIAKYLSCYYALQFMHMNFRNVDILDLGIASDASITEVFHHFMMQIGSDFREITRIYIENLLDIYVPKDKRPEFFICSVGTRADQDDIDIGIITEDKADVEDLNKAFQKITQNMLVFATPLHLYLSEHVGKQIYTTTIPEYTHLLKRQIRDVVIISELINAKLVIGSEKLFNEFQEEVISKYYYNPDKDLRFHEGFLRGILGEIRSLLIKPLQTDSISPKDDAIRMLKLILYAKKTIYNLSEVNAWDIIKALMQKELIFTTEYELLFKATSFLEMLKFLLQMYIVQEENFRTEEIDQNQLDLIAEKMGYKPIGTVSPWDQLVIDYYRYVKDVRKLCDVLLEDITQHLGSISTFERALEKSDIRKIGTKYKGSLPKEFIHIARFFIGTKYWEDLLQILETDQNVLSTFIVQFEELENPKKNITINKYISWAKHSPITIIRLLSILGRKQQNDIGDTIFQQINQAFLDYLEHLPYSTERFCRIYSHYPQYIHEYLQFLPEATYGQLMRIIVRPIISEELQEFQRQLKNLFNIHRWSSQYFRRFLFRLISHHPDYLPSLAKPSQLAKISSGSLAMVDANQEHSKKKEVLGDYYDIEFLRIGIGTMRGVDLYITNLEFTEFCDNYIRKLYDICTEEIEMEDSVDLPDTDTFSILAAGGHARRQAYDDDYDLIAIVDTNNEDLIKRATKIVTRMNREILKRGLLPHYRLGDILGGFVNPISKILEYLTSDDEESFIDLSQLLGARMIIGSEVMKSVINKRILDDLIFKNKSSYTARMTREIQSRWADMEQSPGTSHNIKEVRGGLRDIEAIALMIKAQLKITDPISVKFFEEMKTRLPAISTELDVLSQALYFLRSLRNLYRITVAAEDKIHPDYLSRMATVFQQSNHPEWGTSELIIKQLKIIVQQSGSACESMISFLKKQT